MRVLYQPFTDTTSLVAVVKPHRYWRQALAVSRAWSESLKWQSTENHHREERERREVRESRHRDIQDVRGEAKCRQDFQQNFRA